MTKRRTMTPAVDAAEATNQVIREQIKRRAVEKQVAEDFDLDLRLREAPAATVEEFIDQFDKQAFGQPRMSTRVVYGPDPLLNNCPEFRVKLEQYGKEGVAERFRIMILEGARSPDPLMARMIDKAVAQFGKEAVAQAQYDRIMRIPEREIQIDLSDAIDTMITEPMKPLVDRYGRPGMSVKFLSDFCIKHLGMRGYKIVTDEHGDPVRCGTLIMGEIPADWAEKRRQHWADKSVQQLREQEEEYRESQAQAIHDAGARGIGMSTVLPGEHVTAEATEDLHYLGDTRETGFNVRRGE